MCDPWANKHFLATLWNIIISWNINNKCESHIQAEEMYGLNNIDFKRIFLRLGHLKYVYNQVAVD